MSISLITLYGEQITDYVWVREGSFTEAELEDIFNVFTPDSDIEFTDGTLFLAKFNNTLSGGTYETDEDITGWEIYKQKENNSQLEFVASMGVGTDFIVDHMVENGVKYVYYVFPTGTLAIGSPVISETVSSKAWNWVLFTATESEQENVLIATHAYVFQGNVASGSISNNSNSTVLNNFTKYPKIIKGTTNYKSGVLKSLIGYVDYTENTYTESAGLRDALMALSTSNERMFLKNRAGDIWEVSVHSAIAMETLDTSSWQPNTISLPWAEIADTSDLSLISTEELSNG